MADYSANTWKQVDIDNTSPVPAGLPLGSDPDSIYDLTWMQMGAAKREYDRVHPTVISTGTGSAYEIQYEVFDGYAEGQTFRFMAHADNADAPTLNINGLGAKAIIANGGVAITANEIKEFAIVAVHYDGVDFLMEMNLKQTPLVPGVDVQAHSDLLDDISELSITSGSILVGTAAEDISVLPAGTEGYVLTIMSGRPTWASQDALATEAEARLMARRLSNYYKLV